MEELTTRRLDLRRQMLENTREAETIQRQRKRGRDYAAKFTEGRPHKKHRRCLLLFLAVAGGHADIAVSMLQRVPKFKFPWQDWSDERRRVFVEDVGLQSPWEDLLEAVDVQDSTNAKLCHTARRLFAEARTATWARALNRERGITPSSRAAGKACASRDPEIVRVDLGSLNALHCWAWRFRQRWNGSIGRVKAGEIDDLETLRQKAEDAMKEVCFPAPLYAPTQSKMRRRIRGHFLVFSSVWAGLGWAGLAGWLAGCTAAAAQRLAG